MLNKKTFLLLATLWTIVITVLSLITFDSSIGSEIKIPNKDKMVHFVFYFLFVILWNLYIDFKMFHPKKAIVILFTAIGYGVLMEIFQGIFTTERTADAIDVLANSTGAIIGLITTKIYFQNKTH
ncbi:VanZ family protein [Flavobacterium sp.]|uniref:VanZ family protein n=1 Tax=Flavobacterium sp. TaxID=239 RepID=UPI0026218D9C|nr:VanZ family protein [Flavobacterium sp.]